MTNTEHASGAGLAIAPDDGNVVALVASLDNIVTAFEAYQRAKTRLLTDDDTITEGTGRNARTFTKRSGWRKLAIAFGCSAQIIDHEVIREGNKPEGRILRATCTARAVAPNGRTVDGLGAASADERCCAVNCDRPPACDFPCQITDRGHRHSTHRHCPAASGEYCDPKRHFTKPEHDILATAETRAKNRAYADLFGMGEISAEEADPEAGGANWDAQRATSRGDSTPDRRARQQTPAGKVDRTGHLRVKTQKALAEAGEDSDAATAMTLIIMAKERHGLASDAAIWDDAAEAIAETVTAMIADGTARDIAQHADDSNDD